METPGAESAAPDERNARLARGILEAESYAVLSTADAAGVPWATPVWFAFDGRSALVWLSWPGARHSVNLATRPQLSAVVFDGTAAPDTGQGVYLAASATVVTEPDAVELGLATLSAKLVARGGRSFAAHEVAGEARLRLYRADLDDVWVLDPDSRFDERIRVHL